MVKYLSRACLGAVVAMCFAWPTVPEAKAQGAQYQRPSYGARGIGRGDWIFVPRLPTVYQRPRPDYDPLGIRLGSFDLNLEATVTAGYDDNVFYEEDDTEDDFVFTATPAFRLQSDWNVHMLGFEGSVTGTKYVDETDADNVQGQGTAFGRLDITRDDQLYGSAGYRRQVRVGDDDADDDGVDLTEIDRYFARVGYAHQFTNMNLRVDAQGQRLDFLDFPDNDRDRNQFDLGTRLEYALSPRITPFIQGGVQVQDFDASVDDTGVDRDQQQYAALVGARILITDLLLGEIAVGVEHTEFDEPTFDPITTPQVFGSLIWNPTLLTSVILNAQRTEEPTTAAGASSRVVSAAGLRVEHELLRNLLLYGQAGYRNDDYEDIDRTDHRFTAGVGGDFLLDRNFSFFASYDFETRTSDGGDDEFTRNFVLVGVRAQY
jgi:hypothetical protein